MELLYQCQFLEMPDRSPCLLEVGLFGVPGALASITNVRVIATGPKSEVEIPVCSTAVRFAIIVLV